MHKKKYLSRQRSDSNINNRSISNKRQPIKNSPSLHHSEPSNVNSSSKILNTKKSKNQRPNRNNPSDASITNFTPDLELFNLKIHDSDNDLEILSHQKTRKLISTDLNSIISGSSTPVRGQPAKYIRPRNG